MTDIAKCAGWDCDKKDNCYRYTCSVTLHQSWLDFDAQKKPCKFYKPLALEEPKE